MPQPLGCLNPLDQVQGTGYNAVAVPGPGTKGYTSITDELLYEIWQTNLQIIAALNPPGMVTPIIFTIGDGKAGTPLDGTTSFHASVIQGQNIVDKTLLVLRNSFQMRYYDGVTHYEIIRFNDHVNGGFDMDPASGITFANGDSYQIFVIGANTTIAP